MSEEYPLLAGTVISGLDWLGDKIIYKIRIKCPHCDGHHIHGLGHIPEEQHGTQRVADCFKGEYRLNINDSMSE